MSDALEFVRNSSMAGEEVADMVDTLQERIEELERERDSAYKIADHYRSERDALQADNARLLEALENIEMCGNRVSHEIATIALAKVRKPE